MQNGQGSTGSLCRINVYRAGLLRTSGGGIFVSPLEGFEQPLKFLARFEERNSLLAETSTRVPVFGLRPMRAPLCPVAKAFESADLDTFAALDRRKILPRMVSTMSVAVPV